MLVSNPDSLMYREWYMLTGQYHTVDGVMLIYELTTSTTSVKSIPANRSWGMYICNNVLVSYLRYESNYRPCMYCLVSYAFQRPAAKLTTPSARTCTALVRWRTAF